MSHASARRSQFGEPSPTNQHKMSITSLAPTRTSLLIPFLSAKAEHFVEVQLGKSETNVSFMVPYFEPHAPVSVALASAASSAEATGRRSSRGAYAPYVSEKTKSSTSLSLYFSRAPADEQNLNSYEWVESISSSASAERLKEVALPAGARNTSKSDQSESVSEHFSVGPPADDDDEEYSVQTQQHGTSASRTSSPTDPSSSSVVFAISGVRNSFYVGIYAPTAVQNVVLTVAVSTPVKPSDDVRHPLRMCRMHSVSGDTHDMAVEWIAKQRTRLLQGLISLTEDQSELHSVLDPNPPSDLRRTFLHVIAESLGDPRFGRMLFKHCSRFLRKDEKEKITGRTCVQYLFVQPSFNRDPDKWRARVFEPGTAPYVRALELLRLLTEELGVSLHEEDVFGNTVVHYAACGHRKGSQLLPLLLLMGAPACSPNLSARTPAMELLAQQEVHDLMTWDVDEALELLTKYSANLVADALAAAGEDSADEAVLKNAAEQVAAERRAKAALLLSNGLDLPRQPLRLVDVVPQKIRPVAGEQIGEGVFPTKVVDVTDAGYPKNEGPKQWSSRPLRRVDAQRMSQGEGTNPLLLLNDEASGGTDFVSDKGGVISSATLKTLQSEFNAFDREAQGWISVSDMRRVYLSYDGYGVSESTAEIDKMISVMGIRQDGRVTFEEYCILMLRMNRL